jgi:hypothetical protein
VVDLSMRSALRIPGVLDRDLVGFVGTLDSLGRLNGSLAGTTPTVLGFGFSNFSVTLANVSTATFVGTASASGVLSLPNNFPAIPLSGTINALGSVVLGNTLDSLVLGGLPLGTGRTARVQLLSNPAGLTVTAGFGPEFGTVDFTGTVDVGGNYALKSAANLNPVIGGRSVGFASAMTLENKGFSGSGRVAFGNVNLDVAVSQFAGEGLKVSGSTGDIDTDWIYFGPGNGYPAGRLRWNASASYANGTLGASIAGTVAGWQRQPTLKFVCDFSAPDGTCLFFHYDSANDNRPPSGTDRLSQVPDGVYADTFRQGFGPYGFSGGSIGISLPFPFNSSFDALKNGLNNFSFSPSRP